MSNIDINALKKNAKDAMMLVGDLYDTKRYKLNDITSEYIDELLRAVGLDPNDFDIEPEYIWSYIFGFCYARKVVKDTGGKE